MEAVVIAKQYGKSVIFREAKNQNGVPGFIGFIKMTYEDVTPISVLALNRGISRLLKKLQKER